MLVIDRRVISWVLVAAVVITKEVFPEPLEFNVAPFRIFVKTLVGR